MGDPFSRYVQLLLTLTGARELVVVDDGTATMEFVTQLAQGERLVRWHRKGGRPGPRDLLFAPVSAVARRRLRATPARTVEIFSAMPIGEVPEGVTVTANTFTWTRARFGPRASRRAPTWSAPRSWRRAWSMSSTTSTRSGPSPRRTAPAATSPTGARARRSSTAWPWRRAWRSSAPTCPWN